MTGIVVEALFFFDRAVLLIRAALDIDLLVKIGLFEASGLKALAIAALALINYNINVSSTDHIVQIYCLGLLKLWHFKVTKTNRYLFGID